MGEFTSHILYTRATKGGLTLDSVNNDNPFNQIVHDAQIAFPTLVRDAREREQRSGESFTLAAHGFQLLKGVPNSVPKEKFEKLDKKYVEGAHYKEMADCIHRVVPGAHVIPFHYLARSSKSGGNYHKPADVAHLDYTVHTAMELFDTYAEAHLRRGRFMVVNAWRNISSTPITNHHLAVCEAKSVVAPDDFVPMEVIKSAGESNLTYRLDPTRRLTHHRWWYYPNMQRDETLLFMQYDSEPTAQARYCFHTAVVDPRADPNFVRTSFETRFLVLLPDAKPDSIPDMASAGLNKIERIVAKMIESLGYPTLWPTSAKYWMKKGIWKNGAAGVQKTVQEWMEYSVQKKEFGMDRLSKEELGQVYAGLMADNIFEVTAKRHFPEKGGSNDAGCSSS